MTLGSIPIQDLIGEVKLSPDALSLLRPDMSAADALSVLQKQSFSHECIPLLSEVLPERERVWWASQAAKRASSHFKPEHVAAIQAAEAWAKSPSPDAAMNAATAAAKAGHGGPAGWAAQSAAWAEPTIAGGVPGLSKHAATGAVQLALASLADALPAPAAGGAAALATNQGGTASANSPAVVTSGDHSAQESGHGTAAKPADGSKTGPSEQPLSKEDRKKISKAAEPFVKLGQDIVGGLVPW